MNDGIEKAESEHDESDRDTLRILYGDFGSLINLIGANNDFSERLVKLILFFRDAPKEEVDFICETALMFMFMTTDEYKWALQAWLSAVASQDKQGRE